MDRSLGLIGGGIIPLSNEPYMTVSPHAVSYQHQDLSFPLTNESSNQAVQSPAFAIVELKEEGKKNSRLSQK